MTWAIAVVSCILLAALVCAFMVGRKWNQAILPDQEPRESDMSFGEQAVQWMFAAFFLIGLAVGGCVVVYLAWLIGNIS